MSLIFPPRNPNIGRGFSHASHSASVIAPSPASPLSPVGRWRDRPDRAEANC
jgi:hypothetical protein